MDPSKASAGPVRIVSEIPHRITQSPAPSEGGAGPRAPGSGVVSLRSSLVTWTHPEWSQRFPWLAQGTTGRSPGLARGDFRLFGEGAPPEARNNWHELAVAQGFSGVLHAQQVHGKRILIHSKTAPGLVLGPDADGHLSAVPGTLMAVTVADCVPVFLVEPHRRAVALLHAGWKGIAAGVLEEGIALLRNEFKARVEDILVHLGPAICGSCYEVGPEVHGQLGLADPGAPRPVDLRSVLVQRAMSLGVMQAHLTRSSFCSLCGASPFFSHRGGATQRQVAFLGIRLRGYRS